jgi:hypothetical protein
MQLEKQEFCQIFGHGVFQVLGAPHATIKLIIFISSCFPETVKNPLPGQSMGVQTNTLFLYNGKKISQFFFAIYLIFGQKDNISICPVLQFLCFRSFKFRKTLALKVIYKASYNCPFTLRLYWGRRIIPLCKS